MINACHKPDNVSAKDFKIMSFNVRVDCDTGTEAWGSRLDNLIRLIVDSDADLIGVQETRRGQYVDMVNNLHEYSSVGSGRDDGMESGEYTPIFYKKSRFSLIETKTFWLSETPETPSIGWDAMFNRICTYAVLLDNNSQKKFVHFNTHLDHVGEVARVESAKLISQVVLDKKMPALITGDFNVFEGSDPYSIMTRQGLRDAKFSAESSMSHGSFHGYNPTDELCSESPIDFIFHTDSDFHVKSYRVIVNGSKGVFTSDHYPIVAILTDGDSFKYSTSPT